MPRFQFSTLSPRIAERFTIDLRSLALFRVALATVLIGELSLRFLDIGAFYTDLGLLPRDLLIQTDGTWRLSLFLASGHALWSWLLIAVAWLAAVAMWFGWRTRAAVLVLFVIIGSLQGRNPLLLIGGDMLIMCLLFWSLFLPLAARWSVDAAVARTPPPVENRYCSFATAGLLIQVVSVYFFSAVLKSGHDWWPDGTAVYYALELQRYATPLGRWLQQFDLLTQGLTWFVYFLEWLAPVLVFAPIAHRSLRFIAMLLLMLMHVGFWLCLELGHFPFVSLASLTVLAGGWIWDALDQRLNCGRDLRIYYDRDCGFCLASCHLLRSFLILPHARIEAAQDTPRAKALMEAHWSWVVIDRDNTAHLKFEAFIALLKASPLLRWVSPLLSLRPMVAIGTRVYDSVANSRGEVAGTTAWLWQSRDVRFIPGRALQAMAGAFVIAVLAWNLATIQVLPKGVMSALAPSFRTLRIDQLWDMFAPQPSRLDGWTVFPGELENGQRVDVLKPRQALDWNRPARPNQHENVRWHTLRWRLLALRSEPLFEGYGRYLCREWNRRATPGERLLRFDMVFVIERSRPRGEAREAERQTAWRHHCVAPEAPAELLLPDLSPVPDDEEAQPDEPTSVFPATE
jgi:predicted DCC family thiol-disulfide oxidoreductase YuxK